MFKKTTNLLLDRFVCRMITIYNVVNFRGVNLSRIELGDHFEVQQKACAWLEQWASPQKFAGSIPA